VARSWVDLPIGRVVRLSGVNADATALSVEPPPDGAPAILTYFADAAPSVAEMVSTVLCQLEKAAVELFPAWLPGAEGIDGPGGAGVHAVRALALRLASATRHFGPFLADLAELSLAGTARRAARFGPEVRAAGLARVVASSFGRRDAAILMQVPEGLAPAEEEVLVAGCEWLADRGGFGVWLTGPPLVAVDRVEAMTLRLATGAESLAREVRPLPEGTGPLRFPAVAGMPHPASKAEQSLESALASCAWARGRAWNQTYQSHPLVNPIRVDLLWNEERCVVEIDGHEHRASLKFAADRRRDVQLQLDGYAVLRFTNAQVLTDTEAVVGQVERFLRSRRSATFEGSSHA
jgi:very-short-patch-repair endonuclease